MAEEAPNPTIPPVDKELLDRVRTECKTLRIRNQKYQRWVIPAQAIGFAGMVIFFLLIGPGQSDIARYIVAGVILASSIVVAAVIYYLRATKYKLKTIERWAILTFRIYDILSANVEFKQIKGDATRSFNALMKDIGHEWNIDERKDTLGFLLNPRARFVDRLDMIGYQIRGEDYHRAEAQLHLVNFTDFFLHPSEEEFQKILATKINIPVGKTVKIRYDILAILSKIQWSNKARLAYSALIFLPFIVGAFLWYYQLPVIYTDSQAKPSLDTLLIGFLTIICFGIGAVITFLVVKKD